MLLDRGADLCGVRSHEHDRVARGPLLQRDRPPTHVEQGIGTHGGFERPVLPLVKKMTCRSRSDRSIEMSSSLCDALRIESDSSETYPLDELWLMTSAGCARSIRTPAS